MARIFISYSRADSEFAQRLVASLSQTGLEIWIDTSRIEAGIKWSTAIQKGLDSCQMMILIVSPEAMASPNVEDEWQYYLDNKKPIIPVMFRAARLHFQLSRLQYINFEVQSYEMALQKLQDEIQRKENNPVATTEVPQVATISTTTVVNGDETLPINTILVGRYKIMDVIGGGGMGTVYQARDLAFPQSNRLVAVKEMYPDTSNPILNLDTKRIFEREINILASLNHRAIPVFLDYFSDKTRLYIVMQYINGHDLEALSLKRQTGFPIEKILEWALELCSVLHYLHSYQPDPIVFRDLKPANIMIDNNDHVRLIDFGLAKQLVPNTNKNTMIGSEGYSAPELYRGDSSPQCDIFSLGATLHHLLTRKDPRLEPPFSFADRPIQDYNSDALPELVGIVEKALAFDKLDRFQSAAEMEKALRNLILAPNNLSPNNSSWRSKPSAGSPPDEIIPVWVFHTEDEIRSSASVLNDQVLVGSYDTNMWAMNVDDGSFLWKFMTEGGIATTPTVDRRDNRAYFGSEDHNFYAIDTRTGRIAWSMGTKNRIRSSAALAHDHVFFGSDDGCLYATQQTVGRMLWVYDANSPIRSSPLVTNEWIIFGCASGEVITLDLAGRRKWRYQTGGEVLGMPCVDNHREVCFIGSLDGYMYALELASGSIAWRFRTNSPVLSSPILYNDLVLFGSTNGNFYAINSNTAQETWQFTTEQPIISSPKVVGDAVYFGGTDHHVYCLDAKSGFLRWNYQTGGSIIASPCIHNGVMYIGSLDKKLYALKI